MLISAKKHQVMSRKGIVFSFGTKVALTMQLVFYLLAAHQVVFYHIVLCVW
jgi:hypothetical protein